MPFGNVDQFIVNHFNTWFRINRIERLPHWTPETCELFLSWVDSHAEDIETFASWTDLTSKYDLMINHSFQDPYARHNE